MTTTSVYSTEPGALLEHLSVWRPLAEKRRPRHLPLLICSIQMTTATNRTQADILLQSQLLQRRSACSWQGVAVEYKRKLLTGMMLAPILQMDDAIIQQISDILPLRRWSAITSAVCNWTRRSYWTGRPSQMLLSMQKPTSWADGNFNEIAEHHRQYGRMNIYHPHELTTQEAKQHAMTYQLPNSYVFKPWYHGYTGPMATSEQTCWDHLA